MIRLFIFILFITTLISCFDPANDNSDEFLSETAIATGDAKAIALAKRVLDDNGGKASWDKIHYISFDYFGRRYWFWDKFNNLYRIESPSRSLRAAGNIDGSEIHLWLRGELVTDTDTLAKYKDFANKVWINDTYWLIFPFKLLDPGVKLKYLGDCMADSVTNTTCIELTFEKVGVTPQNKYIAYIDTLNLEVIKWDFYESATDSLPAIENPWTDYRQYGNIKLSGGRGDDSLRQIAVHDKLPEELFTNVSKPYHEILKK